jgi:hypothetical protein
MFGSRSQPDNQITAGRWLLHRMRDRHIQSHADATDRLIFAGARLPQVHQACNVRTHFMHLNTQTPKDSRPKMKKRLPEQTLFRTPRIFFGSAEGAQGDMQCPT